MTTILWSAAWLRPPLSSTFRVHPLAEDQDAVAKRVVGDLASRAFTSTPVSADYGGLRNRHLSLSRRSYKKSGVLMHRRSHTMIGRRARTRRSSASRKEQGQGEETRDQERESRWSCACETYVATLSSLYSNPNNVFAGITRTATRKKAAAVAEDEMDVDK